MRTVPVCVCLFVSAPDGITDEGVRHVVMHALRARVPDKSGTIRDKDALLGEGPLVVSGASLLMAHGEYKPGMVADVGTADPVEVRFV